MMSEEFSFSRRQFLRKAGLSAALIRNWTGSASFAIPSVAGANGDSPRCRVSFRYPSQSPVDELREKAQAGVNSFVTENYAGAIETILSEWSAGLRRSVRDVEALRKSLVPSFKGTDWSASEKSILRAGAPLNIEKRYFPTRPVLDREPFLEGWVSYLSSFRTISVAEFQVSGIRIASPSPLAIETLVRYNLVGEVQNDSREERVGHWVLEWQQNPNAGWQARTWQIVDELRSQARGRIFTDITARCLAGVPSYAQQMLVGADHWRTVLDVASGIDIYGNNGVAVGDVDGDGFDDFYVCQPSGLPNRLYQNRGDGTFEDVTERYGVAVLDGTSSALFADFDNDGHQDLLVVTTAGPLLFLNRDGKFELKQDAFHFKRPPQGTFTGASAADYDRDGALDVYFCLYNFYRGLSQYNFPTPYYDAQNGPPNFMFKNRGDATFEDVTVSSGMDQNNNRYSYDCDWCDYNHDGWPDLYVVNDFGRKNLYRNNGDGTFNDVAGEAGVEDHGAGMSACWFDYDNDGQQDLYVANMWVPEGQRVMTQDAFLYGTPEKIRALYRMHADGNALFRNPGDGQFENTSSVAGVKMGQWNWASDTWDFDHDGYPDLYIADGFISGPNPHDFSSFFWQEVVGHSLPPASNSLGYKLAWNAMNELIRSDGTWSGYQRNVFYVNNRDGTFSEVSGAVGMDFIDDSRAFALADLDHDGRLEVILKNRSGPQLRILHNDMTPLGSSIVFRLKGRKSNRDAIGASVTVEAGERRITKFLQAGSGFLSQNTKELFFGLGNLEGSVPATVHWPNGNVQRFEKLPVNHRIEIEEGVEEFQAKPYKSSVSSLVRSGTPQSARPLPSDVETWLVEPLPAPEFALPDAEGSVHTIRSFGGHPLLLHFWATGCPASVEQLARFEQNRPEWETQGLHLVSISVDGPPQASAVEALVRAKGIKHPILLADEQVLGTYSLLYRYLFDRRRDLSVPTSFLLDEQGSIIKVYQGSIELKRVVLDWKSAPQSRAERIKRALPFSGTFYGGEIHRNYFTYGVTFFEHGYLDQAMACFERVIAVDQNYADAYYNLGTLYLNKEMYAEARTNLERAVRLNPKDPDAWNNLGLLSAEQEKYDEAIRCFREALRLEPGHILALQNLVRLYRWQGHLDEAREALAQSVELEPNDPQIRYGLATLLTEENRLEPARQQLETALQLRPNYPEALNDLGLLLLRSGQSEEAAAKFVQCMRIAAGFDQPYLNLAKMYEQSGQQQKAIEILGRFLADHPQDTQVRQALERLKR